MQSRSANEGHRNPCTSSGAVLLAHTPFAALRHRGGNLRLGASVKGNF
jgi:hypothetical protein